MCTTTFSYTDQSVLLFFCLTFSGATLSIQEVEITITEGTCGQICIVLENIGNGLERNISVTLSITSGTAGTHMQFYSVCVI